jgi:hypothetical protein
MQNPHRAKGLDFENYITEMINSTTLRDYTFHQLSILKDKERHIPDHIIILPHKVIIIEDKLKDADDMKVFNKYDAIKVKGYPSNKIFDSVVLQAQRYKRVITEILANAKTEVELKPHLPFDLYKENKGTVTINEMFIENLTFTVEIVSCIKSTSVTSYQTKLPFVTEESLKLYLGVWESELRFFDPLLVDILYKDKVDLLLKHVQKVNGKRVRMDTVLDFN